MRSKKRQKKLGLALLIQRFDEGQDLWTGEQLQGSDANDWLNLQYELAEGAMSVEDAEEFFAQSVSA